MKRNIFRKLFSAGQAHECASSWLVLLTFLTLVLVANPVLGQKQEATSLDGKPLYRPELSASVQARLEANLATAMTNFQTKPSAENTIWFGRRLGYLGRYGDAIKVLSKGIERFPDDAALYRHRGHRYISLRQFGAAIADFERAVRLIRGKNDIVEPDGAPNRFNMPRSTLHSNIWYHLGLAYYLKQDYSEALAAFRECEKVSRVNDDSRVAAAYWLVLILRRMALQDDAAVVLSGIRKQMDVIENTAYHELLLFFKGNGDEKTLLADKSGLAFATTAYGVATWHAVNGHDERAEMLRERILASDAWSSFGYIAAEADAFALKSKN